MLVPKLAERVTVLAQFLEGEERESNVLQVAAEGGPGKLSRDFGDRVQVISYKGKEQAAREFFGNSLTALTEAGYFSFAVGIILGLILGQIPFPIPGLNQPVRLGVVGGPLIVALVLGSRGRTGPFIWNVPAEVNFTLRHLGILFFLAAVGVKAGHGLLTYLRSDGWAILAVSIVVIVTAHLTLLVCLRFFKQHRLSVLLGIVSVLQTQPVQCALVGAAMPGGHGAHGTTARAQSQEGCAPLRASSPRRRTQVVSR